MIGKLNFDKAAKAINGIMYQGWTVVARVN
jgi:hypothetical protein